MLLTVRGSSSTSDSLIVNLVNGRIRTTYSHPLSLTSTSSHTYNDGEIHTIQVTFTLGELVIVIDGREQLPVDGFLGECVALLWWTR